MGGEVRLRQHQRDKPADGDGLGQEGDAGVGEEEEREEFWRRSFFKIQRAKKEREKKVEFLLTLSLPQPLPPTQTTTKTTGHHRRQELLGQALHDREDRRAPPARRRDRAQPPDQGRVGAAGDPKGGHHLTARVVARGAGRQRGGCGGGRREEGGRGGGAGDGVGCRARWALERGEKKAKSFYAETLFFLSCFLAFLVHSSLSLSLSPLYAREREREGKSIRRGGRSGENARVFWFSGFAFFSFLVQKIKEVKAAFALSLPPFPFPLFSRKSNTRLLCRSFFFSMFSFKKKKEVRRGERDKDEREREQKQKEFGRSFFRVSLSSLSLFFCSHGYPLFSSRVSRGIKRLRAFKRWSVQAVER